MQRIVATATAVLQNAELALLGVADLVRSYCVLLVLLLKLDQRRPLNMLTAGHVLGRRWCLVWSVYVQGNLG